MNGMRICQTATKSHDATNQRESSMPYKSLSGYLEKQLHTFPNVYVE